MKLPTGFTILPVIFLTLSGCMAQESIPAPRSLETEVIPTPRPVNPITDIETAKETSSAPVEMTTPRTLAPDPELSASDFTPGKATAYSSVYLRGKELAMTFDDGPSSEYTLTLLNELKKRNIKATFFLIGQNVVAHPDIVRRIVADGHEIGNHSWSHPVLAKMSDEAVTNEIQKTQDAIFAACGVKPTLMRPPYGSISKAQRKWVPEKFGVKLIFWSVDPLDWKRPGESVVRSRIVSGASDGAIILSHDIHGGTVRAMPETFDQLIAKGYHFATVSQLLAMEQPKPTPTAKVIAKSKSNPDVVPKKSKAR